MKLPFLGAANNLTMSHKIGPYSTKSHLWSDTIYCQSMNITLKMI